MRHVFRSQHPRRLALTLMFAALLITAPAAARGQEYGVSVKIQKPAELAKAKTYTWSQGHPAFDKKVDAQIRAAIDRELTARGLSKVDDAGDVIATYHSLTRVDVDMKADVPVGQESSYSVGTLAIELLSSANREPLFRVRVDKPIDSDREKLARTIDEVVTAMFQKYPAAPTRK